MVESNHTLDGAQQGEIAMRGTPALVRVLGGLLGLVLGCIGILAVTLGALALANGATARGIYWVVILGAVATYGGLNGALVGLNRFRSGQALTLLIAGGTGVCCGVLIDPSIATTIIGRGGNATKVSGVSLLYVGIPMLGSGLLLTGISALAVLGRSWSVSVKPLALGIIWLIPTMVALSYPLPVVGGVSRGLVNAINSSPDVLIPVLYLVVGAILCVSAAVGSGLIVRSLEHGIAAGFTQRTRAKTA